MSPTTATTAPLLTSTALTARDKALRVLWHRYGSGYSLEDFSAEFDSPVASGLLADLRRVLDRTAAEIEAGTLPFCEVCETIHPPVGPGQVLLVPKDRDQANRVLDAHIRDEVYRAGPEGISFGVLGERLTGQVPS